ncbi:MAG TPA: glycoside hydrolase family 38 C-terminal domain-containing protein [Anaerolineae bacterium]|nr:glycoside hydrolase family 38 C-terminal domain-containing protein [Anaerolineae bacterium]
MALTLEWQRRIDRWREELPRHFYRPLGPVPLEGFVTLEQLTPADALAHDFAPMPPGTPWGAKWEYAWFKGRVVLPEDAVGQRIALRLDVGAESLAFVNGAAAGAVDWAHKELTLALSGVPGATYDVLVEGYGGHGPMECHAGPTPPDRETVPEPRPTQRVIGASTFGVWAEDVYQLWVDVETLYQLRGLLDADSLRVAEIDAGLRDFTRIVDFELPRAEMLATVQAGRARLKPLLECVNGSTVPEMFAFGHAHIDVAWLWPLQETERKAGRTFSTQLALMAEYPEYRFLQSQPHLYRMVKQRYPDLYARIRAAAAQGQFMPDGAAWVEPDTNIAGGEALIRQMLHGKRFYQEEFGVESELLWLPDVFGYSGALPQILRGCGVKYFSTQKIFWTYNGGEPFPHNTFVWEGIDGSEVFVHLHNDYCSQTDPQAVMGRWKERVQKEGIATRLMPFGYGDGGGGATRNHLEFLRRARDLEGLPKVRIAHPMDYFRDQEARGWPDVRYVGELYFQAHRGTYTSQARTKRGNRKAELALREAEFWGVAARALQGFDFAAATLDEAWKGVLLNQFHDILPGSSIHRVYEEAEALHAAVIQEAQGVIAAAQSQIAQAGDACKGAVSAPSSAPSSATLTIFNSLSWERAALIALPAGWQGAQDAAGHPLPIQKIGNALYAEVVVPASGWTTLLSADPADPADLADPLIATPTALENDVLRLTFDAFGQITSLFDKETRRELATGPCNSFRMYKDVPTWFDAWDIDSMAEQSPVTLDEPATVEVVTAGPLVAILRVTRKLYDSTMTQDIVMRRGSRRVDFQTTVDWHERHKLLKVAFPVALHANEGIHEIQFGHIRRPNHRSRPFDADRFEVSNHKWSALAEENRGFAVLNDCKYGVNVLGDTLGLTLLKSALAPDMTADQGVQTFTYACYAWNGSFADCDVVREGYDLNVPAQVAPGDGGAASLFTVDAPNVVIETVKPAEDGSADVIVRLYESKRMATRGTLGTTLPVKAACLTDMLETPQGNLCVTDGQIALDFRAFEIKTVRLTLG